jgi:hypothetical protein
MKFADIHTFPQAGYEITVAWRTLEREIDPTRKPTLNLEPDYQRGHVWNEAQQSAYVEYGLMRGESSMVVTCNCPDWPLGEPYELVDGLQRVTAVRRFFRNEIRAFGHYHREFTDPHRLPPYIAFRWRVLSLPTRADVLRVYLLLNAGGVVHSPDEIARVRALLEAEQRSVAT